MFQAAITAHARDKPDAPAFETLQQTVTYGRLKTDLDRLSHRLDALGYAPRSLIGVWVRDPYLMWLTLIALERVRLTSFSFFSESFDQTSHRLARPAIVLTDRTDGAGDPRFAVIDQSWLEGPLVEFEERSASAEDPVRLYLSSGTTGVSKKVVWTRRILDSRVAVIRERVLRASPRSLTLFMPQTGLGFSIPLATWLVGGTVLGCEKMTWEPDSWSLRPNLIALTPRQLQDLAVSLTINHKPDPDLQLMTGGSPTPRRLRRTIQTRVTPDLNIWYGANEAGLIAHCPPAIIERYETAAGRVLPTAQAQVVDDADAVLPANEVGRIRVKTTMLAAGYLDNPELTNTTFRDGWFYPGDMGFLSEDGILVLEGRASEVLNIGGTKLSPDLVERTALAVAGVLDAAAFTLPGPQGIPFLTVAVQPGDGFSPKAVSAALEGQFPVRPIRVVQLRRIPRNAGGKIQRDLLRPLIQGRPGAKRTGRRPRR